MVRFGAWTTAPLGYCMKMDCINRDIKCKECYGASNPSDYVKGEPDGGGTAATGDKGTKEGQGSEGAQADEGRVEGGGNPVV